MFHFVVKHLKYLACASSPEWASNRSPFDIASRRKSYKTMGQVSLE